MANINIGYLITPSEESVQEKEKLADKNIMLHQL